MDARLCLEITLPEVPGVNTFITMCYLHFSVPCSTTKPAFGCNPHTEVVVFPADFNIPVAGLIPGFREKSSFSWN